jgi:hypothetical protein
MPRRTVKLLQRAATRMQENVSALHTPSPENVGFAPIAPEFRQPIYLPPAACALSRARSSAGGIGSQEEETG